MIAQAAVEMDPCEAAAHLFGRAMIQQPSEVAEALHAPLRNTRVPLADLSPWTESEVFQLSHLFSWEGLSGAISHGLFGTSVGRLGYSGLCIRVYASPEGEMFLHNAVFPQFQPKERMTIQIVKAGSIKFAAQRPCPGGVSVSALSGHTTGTLGTWLETAPWGTFIGISNNHVLADLNTFHPGHAIIQPGAGDGGSSLDVVGPLQGVIPLVVYNAASLSTSINIADVAWCEPDQLNLVDRCIGNTGRRPTGEAQPPLVQQFLTQTSPIAVWLCGKVSQKVVRGTVYGVRAMLFIKMKGHDYYFEDQIELDMDELNFGDSGSIVLTDPDDEIGGLFFAIEDPPQPGKPKLGFATPWPVVKSATGLSFSYR